MGVVHLEFSSDLAVPASRAWAWMTSMDCVLREMRPWMRMSVPRDVSRLSVDSVIPGQPLFRSRLYVFGFIPFGRSDLTLLEITDGVGFVEQSPMTGMKLWRHERWITPRDEWCTLTDRLTFEPQFASPIVQWFVNRVFTHRHAVLRRMT